MRFLKIVLVFLASLVVLAGIGYYYVTSKINSSEVKDVNGITSILVLGKGGEGHTAPDLTDTIMVAFINHNSKKVTVLSLPRDIWIPEIRAKLNSSYYWGKQKGGNGFDLASENVEKIVGVPINYSVVVDFSLFKDIVDALGGIEVNIENSFVDERYPIAGKENDLCDGDKEYKCRYETLSFEKGLQTMDGETALKFARSRNAVGDEGTDLAREKRQQKVIDAIRKKSLSTEILLNINALKRLYAVTMSHIETDVDKKTYWGFAKILFNSRDSINYLAISDEMLVVSQNNKKYDNQYVFLPKSGSWEEVQAWLKNSI